MLGSGGHQHICNAFWCLSVHPLFSVYGLLLTGFDTWMSVMLHAVVLFFVVFIMSQVHITTAMTITPLVTVVSSGTLSLSSVTVVPSLLGLPAMLGQCDVVLPSSLTLRCPGSVISLASVPQQHANYAMGSPQVGFFFRVEPLTVFFVCLVSVLVYAFYFQVLCWMPFSHLGAKPLGFFLFSSCWVSLAICSKMSSIVLH